MMTLLLGFVLGIVTSIVGNLLTPAANRLWPALVSMQRSGARALAQQEMKALQVQLDQLNRFHAVC